MNAVDTKAVKSDKLNVKITEREDEMTGLSTLCYIEKDNKYLMLHRIKKKNDVNEGKWIGVGGHFEADESPEECVLREVKEETVYTLTSYRQSVPLQNHLRETKTYILSLRLPILKQ